MALVFFSGGIDSTTLAFDVARHPYRYGVTGDEELHLVTMGEGKKRKLRKLTAALEKVSALPVRHHAFDCPLPSVALKPLPKGGAQILHAPLSSGYAPDNESLPHTPGMITWLAMMGVGVLSQTPEHPWGPRKAFFGFFFDGPVWRQWDEGEYNANDTSPEYLATLNELCSDSADDVEFRAPFFDARMDKVMIVQLAQEIGVPLLETSSCSDGWKVDCGRCGQCIRRSVVFRELGVTR